MSVTVIMEDLDTDKEVVRWGQRTKLGKLDKEDARSAQRDPPWVNTTSFRTMGSGADNSSGLELQQPHLVLDCHPCLLFFIFQLLN